MQSYSLHKYTYNCHYNISFKVTDMREQSRYFYLTFSLRLLYINVYIREWFSIAITHLRLTSQFRSDISRAVWFIVLVNICM